VFPARSGEYEGEENKELLPYVSLRHHSDGSQVLGGGEEGGDKTCSFDSNETLVFQDIEFYLDPLIIVPLQFLNPLAIIDRSVAKAIGKQTTDPPLSSITSATQPNGIFGNISWT